MDLQRMMTVWNAIMEQTKDLSGLELQPIAGMFLDFVAVKNDMETADFIEMLTPVCEAVNKQEGRMAL